MFECLRVNPATDMSVIANFVFGNWSATSSVAGASRKPAEITML